MSFSMLFGRVVLPLAGLAILSALIWQSAGMGKIKLPAADLLAARASSEGEAPSGPSPRRATAPPRVIIAEGRVVAYPGAQVVIGAEAPGTISRVLVYEKSAVKRGDVLVEFRAADVQAQVAEASARLVEAGAEVSRAEIEDQRSGTLVARQASSRQEYERAHFNLLALRARRDAMKAVLDRLVTLQAKSRVVSPIDGVVTSRFAQPGETVAVAAPLVTVVDLSRLRIEAEVDEYDIAHCRIGSPVTIRVEGYPGRSWRGVVEEIADILTSRRIRPEDPGRPTDTRVLPVRVAFREPNPLKMGQRVEVEIGIGREGSATEDAGGDARPDQAGGVR